MPQQLPDAEPIVRSVRKGWIKKGRLEYGAYRPSANRTLISVLQGSYGADWCQAMSINLLGPDYAGFAVHSAAEIRSLGAQVLDAPEDFVGHAHIDHIDPPLPPNNPLGPEANRALNARCKELARIARYHADSRESAARFSEDHLV